MADKRQIILRKGSAIDLPGKPRSIEPKVWNSALEEAELAVSQDEGRIFVGPDQNSSVAQLERLSYPYQNIEILGENSIEAFSRMHGDRMREGDNRDYYVSILNPAIEGLITSYQRSTIFISSNISAFVG